MDLLPSLLAFTVAAALLTVTPGLDSALVLRTAAAEGSRPALRAGVGICLGCFVWGVIVALGLGALLAASEFAYTVLKWAGAAYLVWLGLQLIRAPRAAFEALSAGGAAADRTPWLRRGFLTNILNPKVGVFYVSFLPQFIPAEANVAALTVLMTSIHVWLTVLWFAALIAAARPISGLFRRPGVVTWLDRVTGGVFMAFGLRLVLESRR